MTDAVQILTTAAQEKQRVETEAAQVRAAAEAEREANARQKEIAAAEKEEAERRVADQQAAALVERERVSSEQGAAIQSLGVAISNLAEKNLSYRMTNSLTHAYEPLRADFNSALEQLERAFTSMAQWAKAVGSGTRKSRRCERLSKRPSSRPPAWRNCGR